ncbi:MAG: hypothetical protein VXY62_01515 [Pseudomonadota bacterium]|nr:hypothetical protein [Pseudomonadota bacterium]
MPTAQLKQPAASHHIPTLLVAASLLVMSACSGLKLETAPDRPTDLTGTWQLDIDASDSTDAIKGKPPRGLRPNYSVQEEMRRIGRGSGLAFIAHDFQVLKAKRLKIEQSGDSMGVQHWPGVYRDVTWGQRDRGLWKVYAGWEQNDLLIQSKSKDMGVLERYQLLGNDQLNIQITVNADGETIDLRRVFRRES